MLAHRHDVVLAAGARQPMPADPSDPGKDLPGDQKRKQVGESIGKEPVFDLYQVVLMAADGIDIDPPAVPKKPPGARRLKGVVPGMKVDDTELFLIEGVVLDLFYDLFRRPRRRIPHHTAKLGLNPENT